MSGRIDRVPRWLGAGLLVGIPLNLVVTAGLVAGSHVQGGCGRGFLAGAVTGLVVAAAPIVAPLAGAVPQQACSAPPASLGPQLASIQLQSAVSLVVEVIVMTGLYGLLAAVIRRRDRRT